MLAGKMLTTVISLMLGIQLVNARQTLIAAALNKNPILLSLAAVEPFWSTGMDIFKAKGSYSRICLGLVLLSSWGFLSGFLLPIGVTRPQVCPFVDVNGPAYSLNTSTLAAATSSGRLSQWYNYYYANQLPKTSLVGIQPAIANWKFVPSMETGKLECRPIDNPPDFPEQSQDREQLPMFNLIPRESPIMFPEPLGGLLLVFNKVQITCTIHKKN